MSDNISKICKDKKIYNSIINDIDQIIYDYEIESNGKNKKVISPINPTEKSKEKQNEKIIKNISSNKEEIITISKNNKPVVITLFKE